MHASRIAIIGNAGGGKTLLSRRIARELALPLFAIDDIQWLPNWIPAPLDKVAAHHATWLENSRWIIDGWGSWEIMRERFTLADCILFVDMPMHRHYIWALRRQLESTLGLRRDWPPPGCRALPITFRLLKHMYRIDKEKMPQLRALLSEKSIQLRVRTLTTPRDVRRFDIGSLAANAPTFVPTQATHST
jgi:hypothetical protein